MIVWKGWGILAFLGIGLGVGLTALLSAATGGSLDSTTWQGIPAFLIAGAAVWFIGRQLNVVAPRKKVAVQRGEFLGLFTPDPRREGKMIAPPLEEQPPLELNEVEYLKSLQNRHELFWIPMQWFGLVIPVIGSAVTIAGLSK